MKGNKLHFVLSQNVDALVLLIGEPAWLSSISKVKIPRGSLEGEGATRMGFEMAGGLSMCCWLMVMIPRLSCGATCLCPRVFDLIPRCFLDVLRTCTSSQ